MFLKQQKELLKKTFSISDNQIFLLEKYTNIVLEENKKINLTSIKSENDFFEKNILDSLFISKYYSMDGKKIIDIGTGAGIPGIILAICFPNSQFVLIDSTKKKIAFVERVISELDLKNVFSIWTRIENYKENNFDYLITRAVGNISLLLELSCGLLKTNGEFIFYKSVNYQQELKINFKLLENELGYKFSKVNEFEIKNYFRAFISFQKIHECKKAYPRILSKIKSTKFFEK